MAKTVTYDFRSFVAGELKEKAPAVNKGLMLAASAGASFALGNLHPIWAAADTTSRIINAFEPIISLVQGIAYPVTFLMISGGFLLVILGQRSKGLNMMKWAGVGYIGLQFAPSIMQILVEVGRAMMTK